jgi:hypothetical protein
MITVNKKNPAKVTTTIPCIKPLQKNGSFHVGIDTFQHTTNIQGYDSHFLCARVVTIFSCTRQQNFAGAGHMYHTGATFDLMCQQNYAIMRVLPPPTVAATAADAATLTARLLP